MRSPPGRLVKVKVKAGHAVKMPKLHRRMPQVKMSGSNRGKVLKTAARMPRVEMNGSNGNKVTQPVNRMPQVGTTKVDLLEKLWARVRPEDKEDQLGVPIIIGDKVIGVVEVLNKADGTDFTRQDLKTMMGVATTTALTIENARMNTNLLNSYKGTVRALVSLADAKETSGGGHSRRVMEYSLIGAREMSLSKEEKQNIEYAATLHDIGKLSIPDNILNKSEALTDEEWQIIRKHPAIGYNLLREIPFLKEASKLILYHHERYDGKGYPQGIIAEAIPMGARLIAVADAFDNMTTDHVYRKALSRQQAFAELHNNARSQFCPVAVKAFNSGFVRTRLSNK